MTRRVTKKDKGVEKRTRKGERENAKGIKLNKAIVDKENKREKRKTSHGIVKDTETLYLIFCLF